MPQVARGASTQWSPALGLSPCKDGPSPFPHLICTHPSGEMHVQEALKAGLQVPPPAVGMSDAKKEAWKWAWVTQGIVCRG